MKSISFIILCFVLILCFSGCSGKKIDDTTDPSGDSPDEIIENKETTDDADVSSTITPETTKTPVSGSTPASTESEIEEEQALPQLTQRPALDLEPGDEGEFVYIGGEVGIIRNGNSLPEDQIRVGTGIRNYDLVKTGSDGSAEIEVLSPRSPGTILMISSEN